MNDPYRVKYDLEGSPALFVLGSWEIHALFENSNWVEIFHHCKKYDPEGDRVEYAYQLPYDTECPGCGAIQPDEIQALEQMHNMDRPAREWGKSLIEMLQEDYDAIYAENMKNHFIRGDGVK